MRKYRAPGRINLIGEHTDYNEGFVLPAAIDKEMIFSITKGPTGRCVVHADDLKEVYSFDLENFSPLSSGWQNYVMGVVHELQNITLGTIGGCEIHFAGDVPLGAGVSSSAALECGLAYGLNDFFDLKLGKWQLAKACQRAEHNFVGMKCGIMDQFASIMARADHAMLLDCRSLEYEYFPLDLGSAQLVLLNTKVAHELATSAYNDRRESCEKGAEIIGRTFSNIKSLRDVDGHMLERCKQDLETEIYRRCLHVISENSRVLAATDALRDGNLNQLGTLMFASHKSLQYDYEVSCPELDFLVEQARACPGVLGARMMGGGFGGCTINLVQEAVLSTFIFEAKTAYGERFGIDLEDYQVKTADGAGPYQDFST